MTSGFGHHEWIWIVAFAGIVVLALYRRGRRLIGRQRFAERRLWVRTGILAAVSVVLAVPLALHGHVVVSLGSAVAGFVVGAAIGVAALRFTQMDRDERGLWYVPNLYLGIGLFALLIARFVYKYVVIYPQLKRELAQGAAQGAPQMPVAESPMFYAILYLVLGYYLVYYGGILLRGRRMLAENPVAAAGSEGQ